MDDPAKTGPRPTPTGPSEVDEFADIPNPRTRHPALAVAAALLALFLVIKTRADLTFFLTSPRAADLGDARALMASDRGRAVLAEGTNHVVRIHGTPDRESALQVDTKGSWTFTEFFRLFGTQSRIFVHRRENPLPGFRAEADVFEGRLMRFSDLPFEDAIRSYFASHVGATHFFKPDDVRRIVTAGISPSASLPDLAGDNVTLGPNDILAFELVHPGEVEVGLPVGRYANPELARAALVAHGAQVLRPGRESADRQTWVVAVPAGERDRVMNDLAAIDYQSDLRDVRETVKARLADVSVEGTALAVRAGDAGGPAAGGPRALVGLDTIRTLGTVQIPPDAFLIVEAETPREHFSDAAIAVVLIAFASVNLVGLLRARTNARPKPRTA
ncbi:MAG TPA: hypothetical protein VGP07_26495 [Polyangia bacterium]|jgi:hypothetical protein